MSADNVIFIRPIEDQWWVLHTGWNITVDDLSEQEIDREFIQHGHAHRTQDQAEKAAWEMHNACVVVEHGIRIWKRG